MFSLSEFFLIIFVALLVLGPKALQALLCQIDVLLSKREKLVAQLRKQWFVLKRERRLEINNKRAELVDALYKQKE